MLLNGTNTKLQRRTAEVAGLPLPSPQRPARRSAAQRHHAAPTARRLAVGMAAASVTVESDATSVSTTGLPRSAVVGVLGGGQLGRMMALAAANMGVRMKCLDPNPDAPAAVAADHVEGHFRDAAAIENFVKSKGVDVLTMEIEHINTDALIQAAKDVKGVPVATVAIGNAANAGLLAVRIIASADPRLLDRMLAYQAAMTETVLNKAAKLEEVGWEAYKL
ncbi:N5-carboxyaminoimidazole ribonucleotide mutase [Tetrabaena socialis]|uniref:phosphoribosylaminoimidazole carboxylase n=1 Tax=Tetrabaena socialis TaxID=47790 RepID=A0A2J8ABP4_9CHLO|nr:N5-carboxyaminoimidazole ribonucleotide mutase [Tetrabaena socialis]|eukprot:PNH09941.1 N5-carboxyaminoimidazole ribonucleotide mutase [Tetrabaena socialis]